MIQGTTTAKDILLDYYREESDLFALLWKHSNQVAELAATIAKNYKEGNADTEFVYDAALLHDIGIFRTYAPSIFCEGTEPYICHGTIGSSLLKERGLECYALVCERHTGAGLSASEIISQQLPLPHRNLLPISIEEQIICYADKFFSKSHPDRVSTISKIRKGMAKFGQEQLARFDSMHSIFGKYLPPM